MGCVVCLPSRSFFSIPLWIPVEEGIAPRELAKIALESKNLLGTNPDAAVWAMEAIRTEPVPAVGEGEPRSRQLEAVAVLTGTLEEEWLLEEAGRHEIAGRVLPAPREGLREFCEGSWGVGWSTFTRGKVASHPTAFGQGVAKRGIGRDCFLAGTNGCRGNFRSIKFTRIER